MKIRPPGDGARKGKKNAKVDPISELTSRFELEGSTLAKYLVPQSEKKCQG